MRILIIFFGLLFSVGVCAQTLDGISLSEFDVPYIEITVVKKPFSNKLTVGVDYGQERKRTEIQDHIKDDRGEYLEFRSSVDVLNFFAYYDYEVVQAFTEPGANQQVYRYLLRKMYYD